MANGKDMIVHLMVGLIKAISTFLNHSEIFEEILMLKLICLIMQQKQL